MSKSALVIGAAGGVGLSVTRQLIARGYRVHGTVLDESRRNALKAAVPGIEGIGIVDLANADNIATALAELLADGTILDAVAVCAAISPYGPLETTPLAQLRRTRGRMTLIAGRRRNGGSILC